MQQQHSHFDENCFQVGGIDTQPLAVMSTAARFLAIGAASNAVEGFFAKLTKRRLKRGVFHSVVDLQAAINRFLKEHNERSKPFSWTADPDKIIAAVRCGHQALDSIHLALMRDILLHRVMRRVFNLYPPPLAKLRAICADGSYGIWQQLV